MIVETPPENVKGFKKVSVFFCHQCGSNKPDLQCKNPGCRFSTLDCQEMSPRANEFGNGRRYRKYQRVVKQEGNHKVVNETYIPLTEEEVAAVYLGRVRLANNSAIKQVTNADGSKSYVPISDGDTNALMTCNAVNIIDNMLEPYGYKFGEKSVELLTA